ncbi:MAG: ribonuclease PH [Spirochaetes bacterium]|jgi:ribonuclease PH|nr:ribonuclease PH [Spirochaetota bacterium]
MKNSTREGRSNDELRPLSAEIDIQTAGSGAVLMTMGETRVLCVASVSTSVPDHAANRGWGWVTAEYTMLPYSTIPRTEKRPMRPDGRSVEIQRLVGRSLRSIADLSRLRGFSITVDCDVMKADGGTRTAAITGGYIALRRAVDLLLAGGGLAEDPLKGAVAAVSAGIVDGETLLDLEYSEDSRATVDMNVVMDDSFNYIEVQGTGEMRPFSRKELDTMLAMAESGIRALFELQKSCRGRF